MDATAIVRQDLGVTDLADRRSRGAGFALRLFIAVVAVIVGWIMLGPASSASADESPRDRGLGSVGSVVGSVGSVVGSTVAGLTAAVVEAPMNAVAVPSAPAPAPVAVPAPAPVPVPVPVPAPVVVITPAPAAAATAPAVSAVSPVVRDVISNVVAVDVVGAITPVVTLVDESVVSIPIAGDVLGPAPIGSVVTPILDLADRTIETALNAVDAQICDPLGTLPIDELPGGTGPGSLLPSTEVGAPELEFDSAPIPSTSIGSTLERELGRGSGPESRAGFSSGAASADIISATAVAASAGPFPVSPLAPLAPSTPTATTTVGTGAPSGSSGPLVTVEGSIRFALASSGAASADTDTVPSSLSRDPGSSPD